MSTQRSESAGRLRAAQADLILDRESVRAVDRAAAEDYGIPGIVLMENAARGLAAAALEMLRGAGEPAAVIVCGSGNNGGDGYALGRHLHNAGVAVTFVSLGEPKAGTDAATNREICRRMELPEVGPDELAAQSSCDLLVDAIFGTGLDREVQGTAAGVIDAINDAGRPVLAVDVPSGLDCDTGRPLGRAVRAARTVTFVARKPAMAMAEARAWVGEVTVADIGAPVELLERLGRAADR